MKKTNLVYVLAFLLSGCVATPVVTTQPRPIGANVPVRGDSIFCVMAPPDASFGGEVYSGSGREIAEKIRIALQKAGRQSCLVSQTQHDSITLAKEKGATHVIETTVLQYEDHTTGWSGKPDRIELRISLYDIEQSQQQHTIFYEATSNVFAAGFLEWGNPQPSELLGRDFDETIKKLVK